MSFGLLRALPLLQYTPLLPAVATGTIEDRSIVEPVRRIIQDKVCRRTSNGTGYIPPPYYTGCNTGLVSC